MVQEPLLMIF